MASGLSILRVLLCLLLPLLVLPGAAAATLRVAVLDFGNGSSDPALQPLGKGLQSMLITDLSHVDGLTLVERERLAEVVAELDLQQTDYVAKETASSLGQVLGVTHMLTGAFVVDGARMQIDARLVALSGEVLLATAVQGERDAFFELEKDLAKQLAGSLATAASTELAPKTRAKLARIHTADFAAFRAFSEGLSAFDEERYDDALARLKAATDADEDFALAAYTLEDYERIVTELRARSLQLELGKRERDRLLKDKERAELAGVLDRLWALAEGGDEEDRLTAVYLLAVAYGNVGRNRGKLLRLRQVEDTFAMQRTADALTATWFAESSARWPALPRVLSDRFWRQLPGPDSFDEDLVKAREHLWRDGADYPENRRNYLLSDMRYPRETARRLHLDRAGEVALLEELAAQGAKDLQPGDYWLNEMEETLIEQYRKVLRLDDATRLLAARSRGETHASLVRAIAEDIEENKELQELLQTAKDPAQMREWLLLAPELNWSHGPTTKFAREHFLGPKPTSEGLARLARARELDMDDYVLLGGVPLWSLQAHWALQTGPRTDALRAVDLRYAEHREDAETHPIAVLGARPFSRGTVRGTLQLVPPPDYWPTHVRPKGREGGLQPGDVPAGRPDVGILLGAQDIACAKQEDPKTEEDRIVRPLTAWMVRITSDEVQLVRIRETARGAFSRREEFDEEIVGRKTLATLGPSTPLDVSVDGAAVKVRVGKTRASFTASEVIDGFAGLWFVGQGYAGLEDLRLEVPAAR